jgi:hypothetical protein
MSDIITELYLNIDSFKYTKVEKISHVDIKSQKVARRALIIYPTAIIFSAIIVKKVLPRLLLRFKKELNIESLDLFPKKLSNNYASHKKPIDMEFLKQQQYEIEENRSKVIQIMEGAKTTNRFTKSQTEFKTVSQVDQIDLGIIDDNMRNLANEEKKEKQIDFSKYIISEDTHIDKLLNFSKFTFKYIILCFPIILFIGIIVFNSLYTDLGLYLKYQPLVDAYYEKNCIERENIKKENDSRI